MSRDVTRCHSSEDGSIKLWDAVTNAVVNALPQVLPLMGKGHFELQTSEVFTARPTVGLRSLQFDGAGELSFAMQSIGGAKAFTKTLINALLKKT